MVDWSKFNLIDTYQYDMSGSYFDNICTGRFWAFATDVDSSKLPTAGESPPASLATGTWYVDRCQAVPNDPKTYIVTVYFRNYLYLPTQVVKGSAAELTASVHMTHDTGSIYISPEMMGLKYIQHSDVPVFTGFLQNYIPIEIDSATGGPITAGTWASSSNVPDICPFTYRPGNNLIGKTLQCSVVVCYAYVAKASIPSTDFNGVNTTSNIPSGYDMADRTTAGKWRAIRQQTVNVVTREGSDYRKVKRWLMHPPKGGDYAGNALTWNKDKCGGEFTW